MLSVALRDSKLNPSCSISIITMSYAESAIKVISSDGPFDTKAGANTIWLFSSISMILL